jgi:hypothetical protein
MNGDAWCYCTRACQFAGDCCPDYEQACPGACIYSTQCDGDDVCSAAQECVPAYGHVYEMTVKSWRDYTPNCWDALDCYADVYFRVFYGTQGEIYKSAIHPNTNSTNWNNEPFDVGINATDVMQIVFYDSDDASNDDPTNAVCFGVDVCGPVGVAVLQAGGAIWDDSSDPAADDRFYVEVSFVAK